MLCISLLFVFIILTGASLQAKETSIYVIPGGDSIGLQLQTGIYVTGKYDVKTERGDVSPWDQGDIEIGDKILEINNKSVNTIEDIQSIITIMKNDQNAAIKIKRDTQTFITTCQIVKSIHGKMTLGLYVKDEVLGVGTITFIDPTTKKFGALGHSIIKEEMSSSNLGYISSSSIHGIRKSLPGIPGEKQATLNREAIGTITKNTNIGVYGKINDLNDFSSVTKMKVAAPYEVKLGKAEIWTVINNEQKEVFEVQIIEVKPQSSVGIKGIKIEITDQDLLNKTGGIIQGMSGSPIIQNNMLIGAVSHVVIDTPNFGYGVYAMWMVNNF